MLGILQALPNTALWKDWKSDWKVSVVWEVGRSKFYNVLPTRPLNEVCEEYVAAVWTMWTSQLSKTLFSTMSEYHSNPIFSRICTFRQVKAWTCGSVILEARLSFGDSRCLATALGNLRTKPQFLNMYLGLCAAGEHFWEYRDLARKRITQQLRLILYQRMCQLQHRWLQAPKFVIYRKVEF